MKLLFACIFSLGLTLIGSPAFADDDLPAPPRKPVEWSNPDKLKGDIVTHHVLQSDAMARPVGYTLYLPEGYDSPGNETRYPVVYFLHGAGGNESSNGPGFAGYVQRLSAQHGYAPVIIVFPNGGMSGYRDNPDTGINVESMIINELVPLIDRTYRTLPQRESRAIGGFSMGGGGAIRLALKHYDLFSAAAAWAGALVHYRTRELPTDISLNMLANQEPTVRLLMIIGYDDLATYRAHAPFIELLTAAKYPYSLRTLRGVNHNLGVYYEQTAPDFVAFLLGEMATAPITGTE